MATKCYSCGKKFGIRVERCPFCLLPNLELPPFKDLPQDYKVKTGLDSKPLFPAPTDEEMKKLLKQAAVDCNFRIDSIEIKSNVKNTKNIVTITSQKNPHDIVFEYNPILCKNFDEDGRRSILRHELFHPITVKTQIRVERHPDPILDQLTWAFGQIYFEMINHVEHIKTIPNDIPFREMKNKTISNSIMSLLVRRNEIGKLREEDVRFQMYIVLEHSVYFFHDNTKEILKWIEEYGFQAVWEFYSWINEDMMIVSKNIADIQNHMNLLYNFLFCLSLMVDVEKLLGENKIVFDPNLVEEYIDKRDFGNLPLINEIKEKWTQRIQKYNNKQF